MGTPVAALPEAWCYRLRAGTGLQGVTLWPGGAESFTCCIVAARIIVREGPSLGYSSMLLGR